MLEAEAVEEPAADEGEELEEPTRLPEPSRRTEVEAWRGEVRTAAIAAAGGLVAGAATVAAVRAVRSSAAPRRQRSRRLLRRRQEPPSDHRQPVLPGRRPHPRRDGSRVTAGARPAAAGACLEVEVRPPWPYRLPASGGGDAVMRVRRGIVTRLLHVEGAPVVVRAAPAARRARCGLRADGRAGRAPARWRSSGCASRSASTTTIARSTSAFGRTALLGTAIRRRPWHRPRRRPWAWEALAWSVTKQLIESSRAAEIQRRMVFRWGSRAAGPDGATLRDVPTPELIAGRAPAELAAMDLAPARALALIRAAREVAEGRVDPADPAGDRRLLAIREIGPWTVQCLGLYGRGEPDSLPAGDLGFIKLVGRLAGLGRRATVEEVEEFFAPYAPYRGLAGSFVLAAYHKAVAAGTAAALRRLSRDRDVADRLSPESRPAAGRW